MLFLLLRQLLLQLLFHKLVVLDAELVDVAFEFVDLALLAVFFVL